jgi:hypothetical protein
MITKKMTLLMDMVTGHNLEHHSTTLRMGTMIKPSSITGMAKSIIHMDAPTHKTMRKMTMTCGDCNIPGVPVHFSFCSCIYGTELWSALHATVDREDRSKA